MSDYLHNLPKADVGVGSGRFYSEDGGDREMDMTRRILPIHLAKDRIVPPASEKLVIIQTNGFYLPINRLPTRLIRSLEGSFTYRFYKDKDCAKCPNSHERHSAEFCDPCGSYLGGRCTLAVKEIDGEKYIRVPRGGRKRLKVLLDDSGFTNRKLVKRYPEVEDFSSPIIFHASLREYQQEAVESLTVNFNGFLKSPPRSGKTVMGTAFICRIGKKALILAHQREWLLGFQETFLGSETQQPMTDAKPNQVKLCKTLQDFLDTDVCLATFATFFSKNGQKLLRKIRRLFEVVVIDEAHGTPANRTSMVVSELASRYLIGLSGTPARKITEEFKVARDFIGPTIYESTVEKLRPRIDFIPTESLGGEFEIRKTFGGGGHAAFTSLIGRLETSKERRAAICQKAVELAENGHMVLIPMSRVLAVKEYVKLLNQMTGDPNFAKEFSGQLKKHVRDQTLQDARQYRCKVLVGNISLLSTGTNIPRASALIELGVNSNIPKCEQRIARILTPYDGKPDPVVVFTLDDSSIMQQCRKTEWFQCIVKQFNPIVRQDQKEILNEWFNRASAKRAGKNSPSEPSRSYQI